MLKNFSILLCVTVAAFLHGSPEAAGQCLCLPETRPNDGFFNAGGLLLDTCGLEVSRSTDCNKAWHDFLNRYPDPDLRQSRWYAKAKWNVVFDTNVVDRAISIPTPTADSPVVRITWHEIDSISFPELRNQLRLVEEEVGRFALTLSLWDAPSHREWFDLSFDTLQNVDSVNRRFGGFSHCLGIGFRYGLIDDGTAVFEVHPSNPHKFALFPNPVRDAFIFTMAPSGTNLKIDIYTVLGTPIRSLSSSPAGVGQLEVRVDDLQIGTYFLKQGSHVERFTIVR